VRSHSGEEKGKRTYTDPAVGQRPPPEEHQKPPDCGGEEQRVRQRAVTTQPRDVAMSEWPADGIDVKYDGGSHTTQSHAAKDAWREQRGAKRGGDKPMSNRRRHESERWVK
jgi:hypothetical protein